MKKLDSLAEDKEASLKAEDEKIEESGGHSKRSLSDHYSYFELSEG